ncbi:hypothetical protein [Bacillus sp. AK031]
MEEKQQIFKAEYIPFSLSVVLAITLLSMLISGLFNLNEVINIILAIVFLICLLIDIKGPANNDSTIKAYKYVILIFLFLIFQ